MRELSPSDAKRSKQNEALEPSSGLNTVSRAQQGSVKNTVQFQPLAAQEHDSFAKRLGFESYLSLFESSTPISSKREGTWLITSIRDKEHLLWNVESLCVLGPYSTEEDATIAAQG